jgi:hypothetical protein
MLDLADQVDREVHVELLHLVPGHARILASY